MSVVLTEHLPLLATAPDGIQKLRGLILELAVRGKLVPQDPNDEPASELLKRIARERVRLGSHTTREKNKVTPLVCQDEVPFLLPTTWAWTRLGEVTTFGQTDKDGEITEATWVLDLEDIQKDTSVLLQKVRFAERQAKSDKNRFQIGDVLYGKLRPYLNKVIVADEDGVCTTEILPVRGYLGILPRFLMYALKRPDFLAYVNAKSYGMKMPRLGTDDGRFALFPLAPEGEQHRIVAKVDELMALCDRLEAEQAGAEAAHAKLVESLLDTLTRRTDAADLAANWQRLAEYFDTLFTTESGLDVLKQTILQLAVMGKLHEGTSDGWEAKRLDKVCSDIVDCPHSTPKWTATGKICVRTSQFKPGKLDLSDCRFVSESTFAERIARLKPAADDILYSREGGILGVACRVPPGAEICLGQRMMLLRPGSQIASAFLELVLNSPMITEIARQNTTGGAAPRVNVSTVKAYPIPVPPLSEQHRIVAKVDELMALCEQIKGDLAESRSRQARLATTLIESALEAA